MIVECDRVCFVRGGREILRDVSWKIEPGQHWALLGANGSGKTTILKLITGYEWPTSGRVSVLGNAYGSCAVGEVRKEIGWVAPSLSVRIPGRDTALRVAVSGIEASMGLYRAYTDEEYGRARAALEMLNCGDFAGQAYGTLSQGEKQKTLIARALVSGPRLLVLDEPCCGLDPGTRQRFLDDIGQMLDWPDAPGVIMVTHHVEEIREWITHVLVIREGRILAGGQTQAVLNDEVLSRAFDCDCRVERNGGGYSLRI